MQRLQAENNRLCSGSRADLQQFNAFKTLEDSAHGGSGDRLVDLIGDGLPSGSQLLTQAVFHQAVDQQCQHYNQAQSHKAFRFFDKDGGSQEQGFCQNSEKDLS